jgi:hypothetical protein
VPAAVPSRPLRAPPNGGARAQVLRPPPQALNPWPEPRLCAGLGGAGTDGCHPAGVGAEAPARTGGAPWGWQRPGASAGL